MQPRIWMVYGHIAGSCWAFHPSATPKSSSSGLVRIHPLPNLYLCFGLPQPRCKTWHLALLNFSKINTTNTAWMFGKTLMLQSPGMVPGSGGVCVCVCACLCLHAPVSKHLMSVKMPLLAAYVQFGLGTRDLDLQTESPAVHPLLFWGFFNVRPSLTSAVLTQALCFCGSPWSGRYPCLLQACCSPWKGDMNRWIIWELRPRYYPSSESYGDQDFGLWIHHWPSKLHKTKFTQLCVYEN